MRRSKALLSVLAALAALQGCASAGGARVLGGAPAESAWLAAVNRFSRLELRRPAYVALVEFDADGARVVTATDEPLPSGQHHLETPGLRRLRNQAPGVCNRQGEVALSSGGGQRRTVSTPMSRRVRTAMMQGKGGRETCFKQISEHVEEAHRHLLLITSDIPFAEGFRARVPEVAAGFAGRDDLDLDTAAAELARAVAPAPERQWTARVYGVVSVR